VTVHHERRVKRETNKIQLIGLCLQLITPHKDATGFCPPLVTVQNSLCGNTRSCSPDDGHNDARNMLR